MLDVRRLRLLCDLSRLGTIAAVASLHEYTPSAVSQHLAVGGEQRVKHPLAARVDLDDLAPAGRAGY
jgi:DNA-binding transcriptional LysR family regulator